MNLVIVESPTKAKTIQKFLNQDYLVESSFGHVRDLPAKELGVNVEKNFEPKYVIPLRARKNVKILKDALKKSENVILATDEDREGESIAWHIAEILGLKDKYQRIVFHEITKEAIEEALKSPRQIDINLVDAQQARRILDRLVGYKLSPFLWRKLTKGLSAGRVQSVAVRLVVEREKEIENFKPQEYWSIEAVFKKALAEFGAILFQKGGKSIGKLDIKNKEEADKILKDLEGAEYRVLNIEKKEVQKNPLAPFSTSTLQQDAWQKLRLSAKMTMSIAQGLYEKGYITYHRTDSLNLSATSLVGAENFIVENFGKKYSHTKNFKTKSKLAQEAHEAIRPTSPKNTPEELKEKLGPTEQRLYSLIWKRFIASQMSPAIFDSTSIEIKATPDYLFKANGQTLKFDGFLKIYPMKFEETELPLLEKNEVLEFKSLTPSQHFTQAPPRYNEASLVKALEKEGIGRPSTYAPILETIQKRNYVQKDENKKFKPTEIGVLVTNILKEHFPEIVDVKFTAKMEKELDEIAQGKDSLIKTLKDFYLPFEKNLNQKYKEVPKKDLVEKTEKLCQKCGSQMLLRWSRYGKFYACSKFPKCDYKESFEKTGLNIPCPKCQKGEIVERRTRKGTLFYGCSIFPSCDFALWDRPTGEKCLKCDSLLTQNKRNKIICSNKECDYGKKLPEKPS